MATMVTNVKERLRSKSRHRYSIRGRSADQSRQPPLPSVAINGWQHTHGYDLPRTLRQEALSTPAQEREIVFNPDMAEISTDPGLSLDPDTRARSLGGTPTSAERGKSQGPDITQPVPDRTSSLRNKYAPDASVVVTQGHRRTASQPMQSAPYRPRPVDTQLARPRSKHIPIASTSPILNDFETERASQEQSRWSADSVSLLSSHSNEAVRYPPRKDSLSNQDAEPPRGCRLSSHGTARSVDIARNDPSPLVPHKPIPGRSTSDGSTTSSTHTRPSPLPRTITSDLLPAPRFRDKEHQMLATAGTRSALQIPDDVPMPDENKFAIESYIKTDVNTDWNPAVTQEVIHHQKTETIQKDITRDVHVHHYYEYFQPIKVVEVLPAKHWWLDPKTGKKTEIPEPTGWKLPDSIKPHKPDTSTIRKETRHYLVDDANPLGLVEPESHPHDAGADSGATSVGSDADDAAAAATAA